MRRVFPYWSLLNLVFILYHNVRTYSVQKVCTPLCITQLNVYIQRPFETLIRTVRAPSSGTVLGTRGGHRNLQIGRMLDIDLISEPPHAPSPQMYISKVWESVWPEGQEAIHS